MVGRSRRRGAAKWAAVRAKAGRGPADEKEDDLELPPSPRDSSYYQDKVDDFHEAQSRAALAKGWSEIESGDEEADGDEEEEGTPKSRKRKISVETEKKTVSREPKNVFRCFTYWKRSQSILLVESLQ